MVELWDFIVMMKFSHHISAIRGTGAQTSTVFSHLPVATAIVFLDCIEALVLCTLEPWSINGCYVESMNASNRWGLLESSARLTTVFPIYKHLLRCNWQNSCPAWTSFVFGPSHSYRSSFALQKCKIRFKPSYISGDFRVDDSTFQNAFTHSWNLSRIIPKSFAFCLQSW